MSYDRFITGSAMIALMGQLEFGWNAGCWRISSPAGGATGVLAENYLLLEDVAVDDGWSVIGIWMAYGPMPGRCMSGMWAFIGTGLIGSRFILLIPFWISCATA